MKLNTPVQKFIAGTFLSAAMVFASVPSAEAMQIKDFDRMSLNDQGRYVTVLFGETVKHLWLNGEKKQGDAVLSMFERSSPAEISPGMDELVDIISGLRQMEKDNPSKVPHVEHAMAILMKRHGIAGVSTKDLMQFAKNFEPEDKGYARDAQPGKGPRAALDDPGAPVLARN